MNDPMELWLVDLQAAAPALEALEREVPRLSADDRTRALRLSEPGEQRLRLAAYMALRIALERMGGVEMARQPFTRAPGGKPHMGEAAPSFSLSHAGGLALLGVARSRPIGVDLEADRPLRLSARRRGEILAVGAGLVLRSVSGGTDEAPTLQAWCRLEAYAKATGQGVGRILSELGLRQGPARQLAPPRIEAAARRLALAAGLAVDDLRLPPGLYGAVACAGLEPVRRVRRFPADKPAIARLLRSAGAPPVAGRERLR